MLFVNYDGRFGNNLFQYSFGRLLCDKFGIEFAGRFPTSDILKIKTAGVYRPEPYGIYDVREDTNDPMWNIQSLSPDYDYKIYGFFQRFYLYENDLDKVKSFFEYDDVAVDNYDDVVMHVRLTDYKNHGVVMRPARYINLLDSLSFKKLYIVTDEPYSPYFEVFKESYDCVIVSKSARHDFYFMMKFNTIIAANSTFSWWAALFSKAEHKYIPIDFGFSNAIDLHKIGTGY